MPDHPERELHCVVVTPEKAVLDEAADFVAVPMFDGELGVLPGRAPLIGRLGYGELRLRRGMEVRRYFVDGGFVQVRANTVTVLTSRAFRAEDIDTTAVSHTLQAALTPAPTPQVQEEQLKTQERARAQLRVARHREEGR
ncbi:MAG: ATP synthase F1 subunit epsilon [Gemmataceae bacterium]